MEAILYASVGFVSVAWLKIATMKGTYKRGLITA